MSENKEKIRGAQLLQHSSSELKSRLVAKMDELRQSRFKHALNQLRQTHTLGALRRDIAMLKTALSAQAAQGTEST